MKKISAQLIAAVMALFLTACGSSGNSRQETSVQTDTVQESSGQESMPETIEDSFDTAEKSENKTLLVYFSPANADTVDAISSATPRTDDVSSVEYLAQMIHERVESDIAPIVPTEAYPVEYEDTANRARQEADDNARPEFTLDVNPEEYDVIIVGYPIWWYQMRMVMQTFFDIYDFSEKTIIPFNTHLGSRDSGTYEDISELEPNATVLEGLAVSREQVQNAEEAVTDWIAELGL